MGKSLLHRILLVLLTASTIYSIISKPSFHHFNENKNNSLPTLFSGRRMQLKFNRNTGYVIPTRTKNSAKMRTLILIILTVCVDVSSNPCHQQLKSNLRNRKRHQMHRPSLPNWIYEFPRSSKNLLLNLKNLQRSSVKKELHIQYLHKYYENEIIPPGLICTKVPQIKSLNAKHKQAWNTSLKTTSNSFSDILISQHQSDFTAITQQIETLKSNSNNSIIKHKKSLVT